MKIALTIAGSDSGGGAGIQADLKTFHQLGVFGTSVITAITAQNTVGVSDWESVSTRILRAQIQAVASDLRPSAFKTGMLGSAGIIGAIAEEIRAFNLTNYVLDPVMVATSGDMLIDPDAVDAIRTELIPLSDLVTPNADEAAVLSGHRVSNTEEMKRAAIAIRDLGAKAVLIKGGHVEGDEVVDLLYDGENTRFSHPRIDTTSTHGTGCTLSAAVAAYLAQDCTMRESVRLATDFVHRAIANAPDLGSGHGPLNHFVGRAETNSRTIA
ncbi:MAG TPA: bifunctional hydroxymethylpyrimidine kinase/phosphomethylpyrimidine kinase [Gemmatimonadaceae bacterium]